MLSGDHDVCLLEAIGSDEGVHSRDLDVVELLAGFLDHWFVSFHVHDEHQCVVVFNGLDGALSAQWVLDDGILVPGLLSLDASSGVLGGTGKSEGLGSSEGGVGPHLVLSDCVASLLHGRGGSLGLSLFKNRLDIRNHIRAREYIWVTVALAGYSQLKRSLSFLLLSSALFDSYLIK